MSVKNIGASVNGLRTFYKTTDITHQSHSELNAELKPKQCLMSGSSGTHSQSAKILIK